MTLAKTTVKSATAHSYTAIFKLGLPFDHDSLKRKCHDDISNSSRVAVLTNKQNKTKQSQTDKTENSTTVTNLVTLCCAGAWRLKNGNQVITDSANVFHIKWQTSFIQTVGINIIIIIIVVRIMETTESGLRGLYPRNRCKMIKSQTLVTKYYSKLRFPMPWRSAL